MSPVLSVPATTLREFCHALVSASAIPDPRARSGTLSIQAPEDLASLCLYHDRTQLILATVSVLAELAVDDRDLRPLLTNLRGETAACSGGLVIPRHGRESMADDVTVQLDEQHASPRPTIGTVTRLSITYTADTPDGPKHALVGGRTMGRCVGSDRYNAVLEELSQIIEDTIMAGGGRADDALLDLIRNRAT
jgi:hypothetical protein